MKFDLNNLNPGTWFLFDDDNPDMGRICLRVCPEEKIRKIGKATTKKVVKYKNHQPYESIEAKEGEANKRLWDYVIVDWENVIDAANEDIPCTTETKHVLMGGDPGFSKFVTDRLKRLKQMEIGDREKQEKN